MKIYKYILIIGVIFFTSCDDFLDVKPANVLVVNSYPDVKSLMGSHIKMFKDGNNRLLPNTTIPFYSGAEDYILFYFYSDNFKSETYLDNWTGRNNSGLLSKSIDWKNINVNEDIWKNYYGNIGFYNMILRQVGLHPGENDFQTNIIKGEAKVLRAWSFFKLVQYFSPYHNNELGLPINTDPEAVGSYDSKRKTQTENYEFIINELKEVLSYKTTPSDSYNLFFNKNIINAILAEVYLYKGDSGAKADDDYTNAVKYAQAALTGGNLSFANFDRKPKKGDEFKVYTDQPYALLSFLLADSGSLSNIVGYPQYGIGQYTSESLYSLFSDTDKRKQVFFNSNKQITKFEGPFEYSFYKVDLFTAAELQLIIAESYARQGKDSEATTALKEFTKTRYTTYTVDSSKSLLQNILDERRKEFCFEYDMRWVDLTRIQKGWTRNGYNKSKAETYTIEDNDFRFCMPIPVSAELQHNKIPQNPGWGSF